jgi:hypothetical protein
MGLTWEEAASPAARVAMFLHLGPRLPVRYVEGVGGCKERVHVNSAGRGAASDVEHRWDEDQRSKSR